MCKLLTLGQYTLIGLILFPLAVSAQVAIELPNVHSGENAVSGSISGTAISITIDTNSDGTPAAFATGIFLSNLGRAAYQSVLELAPVTSPSQCPPGHLEFQLVEGGTSVITYKNGDQLFFSLTSAVYCLDPVTLDVTQENRGVYAGGTGVFDGATGTFSQDVTGTISSSDFVDFFIPFTANHVGPLILP